MKDYTKDQMKSSIGRAITILDEPCYPCTCATWERCRCKENELILQINKAHTILSDILEPNEKRAAELAILSEI